MLGKLKCLLGFHKKRYYHEGIYDGVIHRSWMCDRCAMGKLYGGKFGGEKITEGNASPYVKRNWVGGDCPWCGKSFSFPQWVWYASRNVDYPYNAIKTKIKEFNGSIEVWVEIDGTWVMI